MLAEILYYLFLSFFIVFIGTLFIVGCFLLYRAEKTKLYNLIYIGLAFIFINIGLISNLMFNLGDIFQQCFILISYVLVTLFVNLTFHKNRRSQISKLILLLVLSLGVIVVLFRVIRTSWNTALNYYLNVSLDVVYNLLTFNWMAWSSYSAYKHIKSQDIQPWIKTRYKMISFFSFILSLNVIPQLFQPWDVAWGDPNNPISLIVFGLMASNAITFSIGFLLAWIMPQWLKRFINKGYQSLEVKDFSEEELMDLIKKKLTKGGSVGNN